MTMKSSGAARFSILALGFLLAWTSARGQDITIVANPSIHISQISEAQLRDIFTGVRSRFDDGSHATPVLLKGGPAHEVFLSKHIGDSADDFRTRWRKAMFTGQGSMPREFPTEAALLQYVLATPGAIGYVSHVPAGVQVKVLPIVP